MSALFGHIGGVPVEETIGTLGPALLAAVGMVTVNMRAKWRARRSRG